MATDDQAAPLAALYLRNREAMLRAAYAILRDRHDAEDAVSTAIAKVMARLADGHQVDDPDAYLLQAVRNAALDERRASARRRGSPSGTSSLPARSPQAHLTDWPAKSPKKPLT